jgi:hypothetical protein
VIARELEALRAADPALVARADQAVRGYRRGPCASALERLELACLTAAAARACKEELRAPGCAEITDVLLAVAVAEDSFVSPDERTELSLRAGGRRELAQRIRRARSELALDFRLRAGAPGAKDARLPAQIDAYCLRTAHETLLAWQACAASLIWTLAGPGPAPAETARE